MLAGMRLLSLIAVAAAALSVTARGGDDVILGPGFVKGQVSAHRLVYSVPEGWREDVEAAKKADITAVLLPADKTMAEADAAITIAFQRKDATKPGLATLKGFFAVDMQNMLEQFPDTEPARWQPSGLDPAAVPFMSIELRGTGPKASSPVRVVFIDAGDGYYSVTLTTLRVAALSDVRFVRFFDGLALTKSPSGRRAVP
jgi:hypothetical protein